MKIKLVILMMLFAIPAMGEGARYAEYFEMNDTLPDYTCDLMMYNGEYCIEICPINNDGSLYVLGVSAGHYTESEGVYELVDILHGFTMHLQRTSPTEVTLSNTYTFLNSKRFSLIPDAHFDWYPSSALSPSKLKTELAAYNKRYPKRYKLQNGSYVCKQNMLLGCEMELSNDSLFTLTYKTLLLSSGTFSRDGNTMKLHDTILGFDFYGLICDYRIHGVNFPLVEKLDLNFVPAASPSQEAKKGCPTGYLWGAGAFIVAAISAGIFLIARRRNG